MLIQCDDICNKITKRVCMKTFNEIELESIHSLRFQLFRNLTPTKNTFSILQEVPQRRFFKDARSWFCLPFTIFHIFVVFVYYLYVETSRVYLLMLAYALDTIVNIF